MNACFELLFTIPLFYHMLYQDRQRDLPKSSYLRVLCSELPQGVFKQSIINNKYGTEQVSLIVKTVMTFNLFLTVYLSDYVFRGKITLFRGKIFMCHFSEGYSLLPPLMTQVQQI